MTVRYIKKDLITVDCGIVAHGVNCSGAMNSGVAKAIRNRWPKAYSSFMKHPKGKDTLGAVDFVYIDEEDVIVANCYTQVFYGYGGGKYADIDAIRDSLARVAQIANLHTYPIYIPKIGCGLGGLDWETEIKPIVDLLSEIHNSVVIYVCDLPGE